MFKSYKIIKELGKGYNGISYLVEKNKKYYVIKRQKLLPKEVKPNTKYMFWREIEFEKMINKLPKSQQKYFMKMYEYDVIKCNYQHQPDWVDPSMKKDLENRNKSKFCLDAVLEYKGNILYNLYKKGFTLKEKYCLIIQLLYALEIIREKGFMHQDIHQGNITYEKIDKPIKIGSKTLKCQNQYSLIDYGLVRNIKFCQTKKDKKEFEYLFETNNDIYELIYQLILQQYMLYGIYIDKKWKIPKFNSDDIFRKLYEDKILWKQIKELLPDDKKWFQYYEKNLKPDKKDWCVGEKVEYLFSALDRKKYLETVGWKNILPNFIPKEDIIFMVQNITDNKKIIKYFFEKI